MAVGDPVIFSGANPKAIVIEGEDSSLLVKGTTGKIVRIKRFPDNDVLVADEEGIIVEDYNLTSPEEAQSKLTEMIVKYSWFLC